MAGHNKWSKIKHKKKKQDKKRSKKFSKLVKKIQAEAKRCDGDLDDPGLQAVIEQAKEADMPKDNVEAAIERATSEADGEQEITYEAYGPGGAAMVIEAHSSNRNKSAAEIRHILSENGYELAKPGATTWAFKETRDEDNNRVWEPETTSPISDEDTEKLNTLIEKLKENEEVQEVFTNVE